MEGKFFIRDCNDTIVGNPEGYRTMRGACAAYKNSRAAAHKAVWAAFEAREAMYEATCMPMPLRRRGIVSIRRNGDE